MVDTDMRLMDISLVSDEQSADAGVGGDTAVSLRAFNAGAFPGDGGLSEASDAATRVRESGEEELGDLRGPLSLRRASTWA